MSNFNVNIEGDTSGSVELLTINIFKSRELTNMENNLRVLICDDSLLIRKKLRDTLAKCKFKEIIEAENGNVAVELVKVHNPDLIFMDIVMPGKDGIEVLKEIKSIHPIAKVVMASSVGTSEHLKRALENGAYDFIQKPIKPEAIFNLIEKVLKEGRVNV